MITIKIRENHTARGLDQSVFGFVRSTISFEFILRIAVASGTMTF
jgi:hypothetical protein